MRIAVGLTLLFVAGAACGRDLPTCNLSIRAVTPQGTPSINQLIRPEHVASVEKMEPNYPGDDPWFVTYTRVGAKRMLDHTTNNAGGILAVFCDDREISRPHILGPFGHAAIIQGGSGGP